MVTADLHLHTVASDGTWRPEQLVAAAHRAGLAAIAVTDHDSTASVLCAQAKGRELGITVIAGVELSTCAGTQEVHLLGLGANPADAGLAQLMLELREGRAKRGLLILGKLARLGLPVPAHAVQALAKGATIGRPHVARAMLELGYVHSIDEAFEMYLAEGRPAHVPRPRLSTVEGIAAVHRAGGIAVCAHPGLLEDDGVLQALVAAGLDGLEVYASAHSPEQTREYLALATTHGLLVSGGSDCHGPWPSSPLRLGSVGVGTEDLCRLLMASASYRLPTAPYPPRI